MEYEVNAVWKIKKETFLNLKKTPENWGCLEDDERIESEHFETTLPNVQYFLQLLWENEDIIIQFWQEKGYCESVCVEKMELFIHSAKFQNEFHLENAATTGKFHIRSLWPQILSIEREKLLNPDNKYFVNDILELEIHGILSFEAPVYSLAKMLWKKDDKDFTFIVGKRTIEAHKQVLRHVSPIFAAALDNGEIKIKNFNYNIVEKAVKLCYEFNYCWNTPDLLKLIEFTNVYQMPLIKEQLELNSIKYITAETVCELANKSLELKADILRSFCVKFLSECIKCQKQFDGTLNDLKQEIVAEVFKKSFRQTCTS